MNLIEGNRKSESYVVLGFIQEIGCTAKSDDEMEKSIAEYALADFDRNNSELHFERIGVIAEQDIDKEIYADEDIMPSLKHNPVQEGIWYATGKAFYRGRRRKSGVKTTG